MQMLAVLAAVATISVPSLASAAGHLTDLGGREVVVVIENAYPPL